MALFGRETRADVERAQRYAQWVQVRSKPALVSVMFGLLAAVDAITGVLGVAFGAVAIGAGVAGWRDLRAHPHKRGHRLCITGFIGGSIGIAVGLAIWTIR